MKEEIVIVTRHPALVALLLERGIVPPGTLVLPHVERAEQIRGRRVIGVLPLHLAASAASVTEIPLTLTPAMRGRELSLEELRSVAGEPVTYRVEVL